MVSRVQGVVLGVPVSLVEGLLRGSPINPVPPIPELENFKSTALTIIFQNSERKPKFSFSTWQMLRRHTIPCK